MKILDRYILFNFIKTFLSVFTILLFIFLLQSVWLYIAELAGKELEFKVIVKFMMYVSPRIITLVLPLSVLLASIMVFGDFAEHYEFAAMKSSGISLQRAMKSLGLFMLFVAFLSFFFSNNVIPYAEYNFFNLRRNIAKVKPAVMIAEGQFNQIGNINIKVKSKSGENGQFLNDVIIHQKKGTNNGNYTVIKSNTGEFVSNEESDVLKLILYDGNYYDEIQPKDYIKRTKNRPQLKSAFKSYDINIDLSGLNNVDFDQKDVATKFSMLNARDLKITIDSLYEAQKESFVLFGKKILSRTNLLTLNNNISKTAESDKNVNSTLQAFEIKQKRQVLDIALNAIKSTKKEFKIKEKSTLISQRNINKHIIALHEKFVLGLSCIILFFIGAPLGALIRKGGMGLPMIIALLIFLTYHFIGIFAKNSAEDSSLNPIFATWLSSLIFLPFSVYLTNRATKDRALFDMDRLILPIKALLKRKKA